MIKLKNVTKYYSSENSVAMALKNINLEFYKGEFVAITGKSGSGKSTLLNVISGMDTYEDGEMYFKGSETSYYDSRDWENYRRDNISFIYQSYNLIDSYTALENVEAVMMICDMQENHEARKKRREKALDILDKVGLRKWAGHKAVHLSSGQKQRLGIARALAKDTDIIIADEPTGNLDIENGAAVMKMLYELSKDKLVIVVTHNFDQVQDYATRKIRLFDGEIAEDLKLKPELYENGSFCSAEEEKTKEVRTEKTRTLKKAVRFVKINRKAQPHRTLFIFSILAVTIAAFFIMYGYFLSNMDDTKAREIDTDIFGNVSDNRLIVRKTDGAVFQQSDLKKIESISYVDYVDLFDYANEISCLYVKDEDYTINYEKAETSERRSMSIRANNYNKYVNSIKAVDEKDLIAGKLPEKKYEVVVPSEDKSLVGKEVDIYFRSRNWSEATYLGGTFTITGIIGTEYDKPYFTDEFMKSMNVNYGKSRLEINYNITQTSVYDDTTKENDIQEMARKGKVILVEGDKLTGNQIRISEAITMNIRTDGKKNVDATIYEALNPAAVIKDTTDNKNEVVHDVEIVEDTHKGSGNVVEVSHEFLEMIYGSTETEQVSVYLKDYAYTDRAIKKINRMGYEAVSPYRISAGEYDYVLVQERMISILMAAGSIIVIFILSILVIYAMMKLKRKDFVILKSLGLQQKIINEMNFYELITGTLVINLSIVVISIFANKFKIDAISDLMKYYGVTDYLLIILLTLLMAAITAKLFNRHLGRFLGGKNDKDK